jgi:hypothetical protein
VDGGHHCLILAFHHAILLQGVWRSQLPPHLGRRAVPIEIDGDEFPTTVRAETSWLLPGRGLYLSMHLLDFFCNTIFRWEKDDPHIPAEIIDHQQEVLLAT